MNLRLSPQGLNNGDNSRSVGVRLLSTVICDQLSFTQEAKTYFGHLSIRAIKVIRDAIAAWAVRRLTAST